MKKTKIKAGASLGITCPAGFDDPVLEKLINKYEKELKKHAKEKNYKMDGLIWIYTLSKKRKV